MARKKKVKIEETEQLELKPEVLATEEAIVEVEETNPTEEEIKEELVVEVEKPKAATPEVSIEDKIKAAISKHAAVMKLSAPRLEFYANIIKGGGTVGITKAFRFVHLSKLSPENGGRRILMKTKPIKFILNDLL